MDESLFYLRIKLLSDKIGKPLNQIERELGYPRNGLHNYRSLHMPSALRLLELSDYFKVSPAYLLGKEEKGRDKTVSKDLDNFFERLENEKKIELCEIVCTWLLDEKKRELRSRRRN